MYSVVTHANIHDREAATQALQEQIIPRVSQAPGFVAGYWNALGPDKGVSVVVFESEDQARAAADQIQPPGDFVSFDSVEVAEVVAHA